MSPTEQERHKRHTNGTPAQKYLYGHVGAGKKLREIFVKNGLTEDQYSSYALIIGDVILGFYPQTDLPRLLKESLAISDVQALRITADLLDSLEPLNDSNWQPPQEERTADNKASVTVTAVPPIPSTPVATTTVMENDIAEAEEALARIAPSRTMARDMEDLQSQEHHDASVHVSEQPTLLRPGTPRKGGDVPQWESAERK